MWFIDNCWHTVSGKLITVEIGSYVVCKMSIKSLCLQFDSCLSTLTAAVKNGEPMNGPVNRQQICKHPMEYSYIGKTKVRSV